MGSRNKTLFFTLFCIYLVREISGHGRLMDPPSRNSMWRLGYPNPVNYDDNQLWCGGATVLWNENEGKCGVCGDNYKQLPRDHEAGGNYSNGIVVRRYVPGQTIEVQMDITTNHNGIYEMRLCENNDPSNTVTQECFNRNILPVIEENGQTSTFYQTPNNLSGIFTYKVKLPKDVTCTSCILQWWWTTGNTWGKCPDGTERVGCGPQETFVNCADVTIQPIGGGGRPPKPSSSVPQRDNPYQIYYKDYSKTGNPLTPLVVRDQVCVGTGTYSTIPGIDDWCQSNCLKYPPNCPADKCRCLKSCRANSDFKAKGGDDNYCSMKCLTYSSKCPKDKCECE